MILNSKSILIFDDLNGQHLSWYQELENEGFTVSIINSVEDAAKDGNQPQLVILNSKLNGESHIDAHAALEAHDASQQQ